MHTLGGEIITSFVMAYDEVGNLWLLYQTLGNIPLAKYLHSDLPFLHNSLKGASSMEERLP